MQYLNRDNAHLLWKNNYEGFSLHLIYENHPIPYVFDIYLLHQHFNRTRFYE